MAAAATLRIGCRVFCNDYRHPVMLAKEAATLDLLSDGRLELGMGAGWLRAEYEAAGFQFDAAGTRIARLEESVALVKALLAGEPVHHDGEYYEALGFSGSPKPVQRPHPPLLIGGGGRRVLALAAREGLSAEEMLRHPHGLFGTVDAVEGPYYPTWPCATPWRPTGFAAPT